jgi:hypothetical protein
VLRIGEVAFSPKWMSGRSRAHREIAEHFRGRCPRGSRGGDPTSEGGRDQSGVRPRLR